MQLDQAPLISETAKAAAVGGAFGAVSSAAYAWWIKGLSKDIVYHVARRTPLFGTFE
jgi:hypothetical protein